MSLNTELAELPWDSNCPDSEITALPESRKTTTTSEEEIKADSNNDKGQKDKDGLDFKGEEGYLDITQVVDNLSLQYSREPRRQAATVESFSDFDRRLQGFRYPASSPRQPASKIDIDPIPKQIKRTRRRSSGIEFINEPTLSTMTRRSCFGIDLEGEPILKGKDSFEIDSGPISEPVRRTRRGSYATEFINEPPQSRRPRSGLSASEIGTECILKRRDSFEIDADPIQARRIQAKPQDPYTQKSIRGRLKSQNSAYMSLLSPYKYKPLLTPRSVRLIRILGFKHNKNHIRCTIKQYDLNSAPPFQAISYTWESPMYDTGADVNMDMGDDKYTLRGREIDLDGSSCPISGNLFEALCCLADSKMEAYLWADAICIDQDNTEEKGSQISLMGDIYAGATNVIVWLGSDSSDLFNFTDTREILFEALARLQRKKDAGIADFQDPLAPDFLHEIGISSEEAWLDLWRQYFLFFRRRRWFRRAWVVQEVALARDLTFQCGKIALSWKDIYELGLLLRDSGWRHSLAEGLALNSRGGIGDEADRLLEYRDQVCSGGPEDPQFSDMFKNSNGATSPHQLWFSYLQYMIQEIRRYQSSNKKDKIYAVLGLAKRVLPPDLKDPIIPDYSLSVTELYVSVTRLILRELPILSCLSYVESGNRRKISELPSWVPDYTIAIGRKPFIHLGNDALFNASAIDPIYPAMRCFPASGEVIVRGVPVDTIFGSSMSLETMSATSDSMLYLDMCVHLGKLYDHTGQDRVEALWRTLIADTTVGPPVQHPAPQDYENHFHDWLLLLMVSRCMQSYRHAKSLEGQMRLLDKLRGSSTEASALPTRKEVEETFELASEATFHLFERDFMDPRIQRLRDKTIQRLLSPHVRSSSGFYLFDRAVKEVCSSRSMFRTKGDYIGLGPENVRYGDEVWIIEGARVPFLLRGERNGYRVVGEAYVHGIMHGEMAGRSSTNLCLH